ncbi:MAG: hypothetical protein Q9160_006638 [Pyrenula sp. 1 TL-2023]
MANSRNAQESLPKKSEPAAYDIHGENRPEQPFYHAAFQSIFGKSIRIARETAQIVNNAEASTHGRGMQQLASDAKLLGEYSNKNARSIAVLGDSGDGKSSMINSLLHYPDIAQTGDIGSACTSVVTEYRQKTEAQVAPIHIEVTHLSGPEIKKLISELVWSYCKLYLPGVGAKDMDQDEFQRYERESNVAWSTMEAAFKHRREFSQQFLREDLTEEGIQRITQKLIEWTEDIEWPGSEGNQDELWTSDADTTEECSQKTSAFQRDKYWPFTKVIRVYLDSPVLKSGMILADLPGLQDTNFARVKLTQDYLLRCDNIFVITKIGRAITSKSVSDNLRYVINKNEPLELHGDAEYLDVAVICTHADDINEKSARLEFCGPGKRIDPNEMANLDRSIEAANTAKNVKLKKQLKSRQAMI